MNSKKHYQQNSVSQIRELIDSGEATEAALKSLQQMITSAPENAELYYLLGDAYYQKEKWAEARQAYLRAVNLQPNMVQASIGFGDASVELKAYAEAEKAYRYALQQDSSVVKQLALCYKIMGDALAADLQGELSYKSYYNAFGLDDSLVPELQAAFAALSDTLRQAGQLEYAQQAQIQADRFAQELEALRLIEEGNVKEALPLLQAVVTESPERATLHYQLGEAYYQLREWKAACEGYLQALNLKPDMVEASLKFAVASIEQGAYAEAEKALTYSLEKNPETNNSRVAQLYKRIGDRFAAESMGEKARESYQKALTLDATLSTDVLNSLFEVLDSFCAGSAAPSEENELLLLQLHQTQEELERFFVKNEELETKVQQVTDERDLLSSKVQELEAQLRQLKSKSDEQTKQILNYQNKIKELEKNKPEFLEQTSSTALPVAAAMSAQLVQIIAEREAQTRTFQEAQTKLTQAVKERDELSALVQKTEKSLLEAIQNKNKTEYVDLWVLWAKMAMVPGRYHEAIQNWQDIIALYGQETPSVVYQHLDDAYRKAGRFLLTIVAPEAEEIVKGDADKYEILELIHKTLNPRFYLEIGIWEGKSLALAQCNAIAIDPMPRFTYPVSNNSFVITATSDNFFNCNSDLLSQKDLDLAFIDGMHLFEFALRDFMNVERHAKIPTLIMIDDIYPAHPSQAKRKRVTRNWTGDVWKLIPVLKKYRPDLILLSLDANPTGLLLITGLNPDDRVLAEHYDEIVRDYNMESPPQYVIDRVGCVSCYDESVLSLLNFVRQAKSEGFSRQRLLDCVRDSSQIFVDVP